MCHEIPLCELDVANFNGRIVLAMAGLNFVLAARLVLQHFHFLGAALRNDLADHFCFGYVAARDQFLVVIADRDDVVERHLATHFAFQALYLNGLARRDAVLLSSTTNYSVHAASESYWETSIIQGVGSCVNEESRLFFRASAGAWFERHCRMVSENEGFADGGGSCLAPTPICMPVYFGKTTSRPRAMKFVYTERPAPSAPIAMPSCCEGMNRPSAIPTNLNPPAPPDTRGPTSLAVSPRNDAAPRLTDMAVVSSRVLGGRASAPPSESSFKF